MHDHIQWSLCHLDWTPTPVLSTGCGVKLCNSQHRNGDRPWLGRSLYRSGRASHGQNSKFDAASGFVVCCMTFDWLFTLPEDSFNLDGSGWFRTRFWDAIPTQSDLDLYFFLAKSTVFHVSPVFKCLGQRTIVSWLSLCSPPTPLTHSLIIINPIKTISDAILHCHRPLHTHSSLNSLSQHMFHQMGGFWC